jgi:hypothetical protein
MKYSIIFCYRAREKHLRTIIPRIHEVFKDKNHEIIVVEQDDNFKFRRANLLNEGARVATGDVLIMHDVDYWPTDGLEYYDGKSDVFLPVKKVVFVDEAFKPKNIMDVPAGYRHFKDSVDDNFFGGVTTFTREAFFKINGFSPLFIGWGFEDADLRERIGHHKLSVVRSTTNTFYALPHPDSGPAQDDPDFHNNIHLAHHSRYYMAHGVDNQESAVEVIRNPIWPDVDMWVKATGFAGTPVARNVLSGIQSSKFNFDEGDE